MALQKRSASSKDSCCLRFSDQAFAIIREQLDLDDWMLTEREAAASHIATGFAQAERGELTDGDVAIEMLRQRRAGRRTR